MDRKALHKLSYGMYVVCSVRDGRFNGQVANSVFQVTSKPPKIAVCINKSNLTHDFIVSSGVFSVSVLSRNTPMWFIGVFGFRSGRDVDKFSNVRFRKGVSGAPVVLDYTVAYVEAEVEKTVDVGTHTLFVGRVVDAGVLLEEEPMTYSYYRSVKHGVAPKNAPTYMG